MGKELEPQSGNAILVIAPTNEGEWPSPVNPKCLLLEGRRQETRQPSLSGCGGHSRNALRASYSDRGRKANLPSGGRKVCLPPKEMCSILIGLAVAPGTKQHTWVCSTKKRRNIISNLPTIVKFFLYKLLRELLGNQPEFFYAERGSAGPLFESALLSPGTVTSAELCPQRTTPRPFVVHID